MSSHITYCILQVTTECPNTTDTTVISNPGRLSLISKASSWYLLTFPSAFFEVLLSWLFQIEYTDFLFFVFSCFHFCQVEFEVASSFPIRFGTLFLCPIVLYTIPYQYQLFQLLLPMWLLGSSIFCYVWLNIQYWPGLCNQQLDLLRSHFAHNILYSSCRQYTTLLIICSNIPIMETVFLGLEFCIDQWLYSSSSCSLNNLLFFRLIQFNSFEVDALFQGCFHLFPCWFSFCFNNLILQLYSIIFKS